MEEVSKEKEIYDCQTIKKEKDGGMGQSFEQTQTEISYEATKNVVETIVR